MNKIILLLFLGFSLLGCNGDSIEFVNSSDTIETSDIYMQVAVAIQQRKQATQSTLEDYTTVQVNFMGQHREGYFYSIELSEADSLSVNSNGMEGTLIKQVFPDKNDPLAVRYIQDFSATQPATPYNIIVNRHHDAELHELPFELPGETPFSVSAETSGLHLFEDLTVQWSALPDTYYTLQFTFTCNYNREPVSYHVRYPNLDTPEIASPFVFRPGEHINATEGLSDCTLTTFLKGKSYREITGSAFAQQTLELSRQQAIVRLLQMQ